MPPRHQTLPPPQTTAAREAQKSFYCTLCSKGYSRMNEYDAHLSSYDHSHKQRLKEMKQMVRDPNAGVRARKAEAKADGLVSIKLGDKDKDAAVKKPGFKRGGFKSAFAPKEEEKPAPEVHIARPEPPVVAPVARAALMDDSDSDNEGYTCYDPRRPTN
ncbi:c2h2 type zinc finger containing protein [Purpureocillium lilacinum]|uniref:C2h2 type zinc finger containing protein n=1 Tax=Purpureocillium lilacinum TaxID=33203 RepID=A0A179GLQ7_PURLI|nr:c2h2 type zinc finger containing protein [Purpureocillium lilacinum]KAK4075549.1 hypothetical protein Purlil1_12648 [Purpureocillium lilacinum]OAQ76841.1 c2h2 type zinc finger containing protein [Purpureocillium lilacinum]OAQ78253.1 c2h2 type zinc finger containing protein [Purpureocillium lilacinum]PWI76994.1 zinc finger domain-containing protein [Purpureocillium lilacinum]GJN72401.1 hypothetical protein PLICBS_006474 [Purpureocillium lilacinum]